MREPLLPHFFTGIAIHLRQAGGSGGRPHLYPDHHEHGQLLEDHRGQGTTGLRRTIHDEGHSGFLGGAILIDGVVNGSSKVSKAVVIE